MKTLFKLALLGFMVATCSTMWHRANLIIETQPPDPVIVAYSDPPVDDATFSDLQATFSAPNPAPTAQPITVQQVTNVSVNVQQSPVWPYAGFYYPPLAPIRSNFGPRLDNRSHGLLRSRSHVTR